MKPAFPAACRMPSILETHVGTDRHDSLGPGDLHEAPEQLRPDALALVGIADEHREFGVVGTKDTREAADGDDLGRARLRVRALGDEGHLPVVVDEADPDQPAMSRPLVEAEVPEIALEDGLGRERPMELDDEWLVLGPDRTDLEDPAVRARPRPRVLAGIRPDRQARQVRGIRRGIVEDHARVERNEALR